MRIYHLDCSLNNEEQSLTRKYSKLIVDRLIVSRGTAEVFYIDLTKEKIPFINKAYETAMFKPAGLREEADKKALNTFDIAPFLEADVYVFGVPGYFFNVPAVFKNWLEHLFVFDLTISQNWIGMLKNKKMYVVSAWGGSYTNTTIEASFEHVIRKSFDLFGIKDIKIFNIYTDHETNSNNIKDIEEEIAQTV